MLSQIEFVSLRHEMGNCHSAAWPVVAALRLRLPALSAFLADGGQLGVCSSGQCFVLAEGFGTGHASSVPFYIII